MKPLPVNNKNICNIAFNTVILTNKGWKTVTEITTENEVVNSKGEWEIISKIKKNKKELLYKITFYNITENSNTELFCTENSVICILLKNKITTIKIKNIKPNLEVPLIYAYKNRFPKKEIISKIEKTKLKEETYSLYVGDLNMFTIKDNILI